MKSKKFYKNYLTISALSLSTAERRQKGLRRSGDRSFIQARRTGRGHDACR